MFKYNYKEIKSYKEEIKEKIKKDILKNHSVYLQTLQSFSVGC